MGGAGASSGGKGGMGMGGVPMELGEGQPTTAESEETGNPADSGNDGDGATRWCAANGSPAYWQVDLGAVHTLTRIEIDFEYPPQADGAAYTYVVTVSADGTTFGAGVDRSTNTSTAMTQTANFPANTSGRHVRVDITPPTTSPSATWASFWEARIYGY
jgi:alpha-L-fucosidase